MSTISDTYRQKIQQLTQLKEVLIKKKNILPDAHYQLLSIEAQIYDNELWLEKYNYVKHPYHCSQCGGGFNDEEEFVRLRAASQEIPHLICCRCLITIGKVMTSTEAESRRELPPGTLKYDCKYALNPLLRGNMIRKSGKFWLLHEAVLTLYYDHGRSNEQFDLSWIEKMRNRLNSLKENKLLLDEMRLHIPDSFQQLASIDAQIRDLETRFTRIESGKLPYRCTFCQQWIKEQGIPIMYGELTLCNCCISTMRQVMTTGEAEAKYELKVSTIRRDIDRHLLDRYMKMGLLRLSGNLWLIHESAMVEYYCVKSQERSHLNRRRRARNNSFNENNK